MNLTRINTNVIYLLSLLLITSSFMTNDGGLQTGSSPFVTESWSKSLNTAKASNKQIFLATYTDWCGKCKLIDKNVFSDDATINYLKSNYHAVKMDLESPNNSDKKMVQEKYKITSYPTFLVISKDGTLISSKNNISNKNDLLNWLKGL
jgi:thioredoxin 1